MNPVYTKRIVGFDEEESDYLLKFLFDHIIRGQDFSCRVRYEAGTVVVWDQRITNHSQTLDYAPGERRHAFRLTPLANKPIPSLVEEDDGECQKDELIWSLSVSHGTLGSEDISISIWVDRIWCQYSLRFHMGI